jgi:hypothetical protein
MSRQAGSPVVTIAVTAMCSAANWTTSVAPEAYDSATRGVPGTWRHQAG